MFRVKVCGVTRLEDLKLLADAGVDAVGINLVSSSPRCVSLETADTFCQAARRLGLMSVLVVMNCDYEELSLMVARLAPDAVQLHGDEQPEGLTAELMDLRIIKALSWSGRAEEADMASRWLAMRPMRFAFLVDAFAPGVGGGTGKVARWDLLWPRPELLSQVPLLLAGGLTAENVSRAIAITHCAGVDTASGVESAVGVKDSIKVKLFAERAQRAWQC